MKVSVTQDDIDNGQPFEPGCCPVAIAVKRLCPNAREVWVGGVIDVDRQRFKFPEEVRIFISHFDTGIKVQPIEFEATEEL